MRLKLFARTEPDFDEEATRSCKNCDNQFQGRYCNRCGEKVVERYERTLLHFLDNVFNAFTFIDGKFWRSLKTMVLRPGKMSRHLMEGKRQPYMKPVAFFFVGNVIYFLFPLFETFNTSLNAQMNFMPYRDYVQTTVNSYLQENSLSLEDFASRYNAESTAWAKMLLIVLAPLFLPFLSLINYVKRFYVSDHFLFAMEFSSYLVFVGAILFPLFLFLLVGVFKLMGINLEFLAQDAYAMPVLGVLIAYFLGFGLRNFYQFVWWRNLVSSLFIVGSMYFVIHAYRLILFLVSMQTV